MATANQINLSTASANASGRGLAPGKADSPLARLARSVPANRWHSLLVTVDILLILLAFAGA